MIRQFQRHGNAYNGQYGMNVGYNEVVIDGAQWEANLPAIIEAFFVVRDSDGPPHERDVGRSTHAAFLAAYGLESAAVPLLELRPADWEAPFAPLPAMNE